MGSAEVAGIGAGQIKAEELDSPLWRGAGVVGGAIPLAGAGAAKGFVGGGEEAEEGGGASGMDDEGLSVGGVSAVGVGVEGLTGVVCEETVRERSKTAKVVKGGREEDHVLVNWRLGNGGVGRGGTTTKLLPLSEVMRASSRSRCKRCITLTRGRKRNSNIYDSIGEGGRGGMVLVMGVKEETNVGRAGSRRGSNEVFGLSEDRMAGSNETSKGG